MTRNYGGAVVLVLASLVLLAAFASSGTLLVPGDHTRMGQNFDLFRIQVNKSPSVNSGNLDVIEMNYTGRNTTPLPNLITNLTVWNTTAQDNLYGFNTTPGTWKASGTGWVFNISKLNNQAGSINANGTHLHFNISLEPGPGGDGSEVHFSVTQLYGSDIQLAFGTIPFPDDMNLTVDESAPNVSITSPPRAANLSTPTLLNATVTNNTVNFAGNESGVNRSTVRYAFDNASLGGVFNASGVPSVWTPLPRLRGVFHNATFPVAGLAEGEYRVRVRANDTIDIGPDNMNDTVWRNVTIDTTAPTITPRQPQDGATVTGTVAVEATWSDALTGVETRRFNVTNITSGTYEAWRSGTLNGTVNTITLKDGTYNISYNATDFAANTNASVSAVTFTVDNTPPIVTLVNPANTTLTDASPFLNATADEDVSMWRYVLDTNASNSTFDTTSARTANATLPGLVDGRHNVTVWANDTVGNMNSSTTSFTIDTTPPSITPRLPVQAANLSGTFFVNATWSDATTNVTNATFNLSNSTTTWPFQPHPLNGSISSTTLNDGVYNVSYNATDFVGNTNASVDARTVTVDNTPPGLTPRSPGDGANVSGIIQIDATWSDALTGVETAMYNLTNLTGGVYQVWNASALNDTINTRTLNDGRYNISYNATDFAGNPNVSVSAVTFTVDNTPPTITIHNPVNANISDDTPWLNVTADEPIHTWLYNNDTGANATFTPNGTTLGPFGDGTHNVTVYANDTAGTWNTSFRVFTVDTTAPTITPHAPADDSVVQGLFDVNATWSDATSGVANAMFNVTNTTTGVWKSGVLNATTAEGDAINSTTLQDGPYNVSYNATDGAGNTASNVSFINISVDNDAPRINTDIPVNGAVVSGTIDVLAAAFDVGTTVTVLEYRWVNRTGVNVTGWRDLLASNDSIDTTSLRDGGYNLTFRANDSSGNVNASVNVSNVVVDNTPPAFFSNATNSTAAGELVEHRVYVNDSTELSGYVFGFDNGTGTFSNDSVTAFSAGINRSWANVSKTVNDTVGSTVRWRVYANDTQGNIQSTDTFTYVTTDEQPPRWRNLGQNTSQIQPGQPIELRGEGFDETNLSHAVLETNETGSLKNYTAGSYGSPMQLYTAGTGTWTNFTWDNDSLTSGTVGWRIWYNDTAGNLNATDTLTFSVGDTIPPTVTITTPANNSNVTDSTPFLNATADEDVSMWRYVLDTNTSNSSFDTTSVRTANATLPGLVDGTHNVTVWANDTAGNWNRTFHVFTVDTQVPPINVKAPVQAANVSGFFDINATVSGDLFGISMRRFNVTNATTGRAWIVGSFNASNASGAAQGPVNSRVLADGRYNLSFNATDLLGNIRANVDARTVTVDNTVPLLTPRSPVDGSNVSGSIAVRATWNDATSGVRSANYTVTNGSGVQAFGGLNDTVSTTMLADGPYTISYNATDFAGNTNTTGNASTITVDTTAPRFATNATNHSRVEPEGWTNRTNVTLAANITDVRGILNGTMGPDALNLSLERPTGRFPIVFNHTGRNGSVEIGLTGGATFLQHGNRYNVTAAASDLLRNRNASMNWSFRTDFNPPRNVSLTDSYGGAVYGSWFKDERTVQIDSCFEPAQESGVDAVAVLLNGVYRPWNTSIRTGPFNVTLNASGSKTYTFACRDVAGNANTSFNRTYRIDALKPSVTPGTPSQDETGVSTSFTFNAALHDESQESFLNTSASNVTLFKKPSALNMSSIAFTNSSVTAEVSGLDEGTIYQIRVTAEDNVGHRVQKNVTFSTQSSSSGGGGGGGGGGSGGGDSGGGGGIPIGTDSLNITDTPTTVTALSGRVTTFEATVGNDGDTDQVGIELGIDGPAGMAVISEPTDFDLAAGDTRMVTVELAVDGDVPSNIYQVELNATSDDNTVAAHTMDVDVNEPAPDLALVNPPSTVTTPVGENGTLRFFVRNRGTAMAQGVVPAFTAPIIRTYVTGRFRLGAKETRTVRVNVSTANRSHVGVYRGLFTITHPSKNISRPITVKIQPDTEAQQNEIQRDIQRLRERFSDARGQLPANVSEDVQRLLQEATTAMDEGDYATAADRRETLQRRLADVEIEEGLPLLLPAGVVVAIIALLAILFYFFPPREIWYEILRRLRREEGYRPRSRGGERRASLRDKMEKSRTELLRESFETAVESAKEEKRKKDEEYRYRG